MKPCSSSPGATEESPTMPTFDVIIPTYNAARFLPMALDSVIAQTFSAWRILLVDDGSKDDTPALVQPYKDRLGDKLLYIRQDNAGLPAARNTAIRHATAEYLALLDADDVWLPNRLQTTYERFAAVPSAGLTYGFNARIDSQGQLLDTFDRRNPHGEGRVAPYLYMRMLDLPCPTVTFRRSCVEAIGLFDESLRASEDRDLWIRIASRFEVALIPQVIALYRLSSQSMSTDVDRMTRSQLRLIEKHYGLPGCGWRARRVALSWVYRQRAEALASKGQSAAAAAAALKAVALYPFQVHTLRTAASLVSRYARRSNSIASKLAS